MLIFKEKILKFIAPVRIEYLLNCVVVLLVFAILSYAYSALQHPIDSKKYHSVWLLTQQQSHPATQKMAQDLTVQNNIEASEYFRLMWAYSLESSQVREYPALRQEDTQ